MLPLIPLLATAKTGVITLRLTDPNGRPVANKPVCLIESSDDQPLRNFCFFRVTEESKFPKGNLSGKTDRNGVIRFTRAHRNTHYSVTVDYGFFEPISYFGTVHAGQSAHVVYRKDCEITGHITSSLSAYPAAGVDVELHDTMLGHMSGYPTETIQTVKTDAAGNYRFDHLPPCTYGLLCAAPKDRPFCILVHGKNQPWETQEAYLGKDTWRGSSGHLVWMKQPRETCDFRITRPATIVVDFRNPAQAPLYGISVFVDNYGSDLGWNYPLVFAAEPGPHTVTLDRSAVTYQRNQPDTKRIIATLTAKEGETLHVPVTLPNGWVGRKTKD